MADPAENGSTGLFCYKDQHRPCGPECMAFLPQVPEGATYVGVQWAHCHLLVNAERVGKHVIIIVDLLKQARAANLRSQPAPGVT